MPRPTLVETPSSASVRVLPKSGAGTHLYAGLVSDIDPNSKLEGDRWYGSSYSLGVAHELERDPHVKRAMGSVTDPILAATWDFHPASEDQLDLEIADFCRFVFFECNSWRTALQRAFRYVRDGSSVLEVTDDVRAVPAKRFPNHPGDGRGVVITGFHDIPRRSIYRWEQSRRDPRKIDGVTQQLAGADSEDAALVKIPADRLLRFTWEQEGANFDGVAPCRALYGPWVIKIMLMKVSAIHSEREGAGLPIMMLPEDATAEDRDEADDILSGIKSSHKGRLVLPHGFDFKYVTPKGSPMQLEEAIKRCNFDIAHGLSFGWSLLGTRGNGSYALATEQRGQSALYIESHARFVEEVFNHGSDGMFSPVERLVRMNYGEGVDLPRIAARNLPTKDYLKAFPVVNSMIATGAITPDDELEKMVREVLSLPKSDESTARVSEVAGPGPSDEDRADGGEDPERFEKRLGIVNALVGTGILRSDDNLEEFVRGGLELPDLDKDSIRDPRTARGVETADLLRSKGLLGEAGAVDEDSEEDEDDED